ncbi:hypothetical protein HUT19_07720 [Streptomyces sp. NA02950]|uniref:hypothetical protein n=1 Tax=Streptomyces sp. NA02950 TaxID=2742137 RepID=UPI0015911FA0|nr:hypothetical protein [Streptomyces sp. NA02950]QKV91652.1 hypothetical protein HUT19_07720 [Streptomyces sp. NA02950]
MLTDTVCAALSAAGLGIACLTAYRKRFLAAARIAAYALLPLGLAMTGILDWIADLVFNPTVWAGFAVLGLSWALFMLTRAVERRRGGARQERRAAAAAERGGALAPAASEPALGASGGKASKPARPAKASGPSKSKAGTSSDTEDFSDIEAILKKHGI